MRAYLTMDGNRRVDDYSINTREIPGQDLMARAGAETFNAISMAGLINNDDPANILIMAGKGNNGGDAFVVGQLLHQHDLNCQILCVPDPEDIKGDAQVHFHKARQQGVSFHFYSEIKDITEFFTSASLIIDGLLGTGTSGEIRAPYDELIEAANACGAPIIAIDVPSGVTGDFGETLKPCVQAVLTVSMGYGKMGTLFEPARQAAGQRVIVDIGFPEDSHVQINAQPGYEIFPGDFSLNLLSRAPDLHKYEAGKVLVIAGAPGFTGAAVLAARAAQRSGAGLVRLAIPESLGDIVETLSLETVVERCPENRARSFSLKSKAYLLEMAQWADCVALGPGLGRDPETVELIKELIPSIQAPLVLDADGLFALSENIDILKKRTAPTLLTPHQGEFKRLMGSTHAATWKMATEFSGQHGCHIILKGAPSVLACPDGELFINTTGHAGLATGGSGDVLTGILAGLWSQSTELPEILALGMVKHSECADLLREEKGILGLIASDLIDVLPVVLKEFGV